MKVFYSSKTGNTKKLALAIADSIGVEALNVNDMCIVDDEVVFLGFWVDKGEMDEDAKKFLSKLKDKKIALFFTAGVEKENDYIKEIMKKYIDEVSVNNKALGCFMSQGKISDEIIAKSKELAQKNPNNSKYAITEQRQKRWEESARHPDWQDLNDAKEFANNIVNNMNCIDSLNKALNHINKDHKDSLLKLVRFHRDVTPKEVKLVYIDYDGMKIRYDNEILELKYNFKADEKTLQAAVIELCHIAK